jgi:hypothetical protein
MRSISEELSELYGEWQTLTAAETEAIRALNWADLARHQLAKQALQRRIETVERTGLGSAAGWHTQFRDLLLALTEQERENHRLLEAHRLEARRSQDALRQSSRNLRNLHRAYRTDQPSAWHSYS